jgi:hypothetical protein
MTSFAPPHSGPVARHRSRRRRSHLVPVLLGSGFAASAIAVVAYLLWPTWTANRLDMAERLPVSIGATLFNVPGHAFRIKVQRHSGPQERVDLSFDYPSLEAPVAPRHVTMETFDENAQPIDRIFLSITAHHDSLAPEQRLRTIYPRYQETITAPAEDGLLTRAFRAGSPYAGEDLFTAEGTTLVARCTRDGPTPGMCLGERRIDGADLTFRFPRAWLEQWRDVAGAMDRLTAQLHSARG